MSIRAATLLCIALATATALGAQQPAPSVAVTGAGSQAMTLTGADLAAVPRASASDGYQVVFSVGELDSDMTDGQFLLADRQDGQPLFGENGSFRLVVPKDERVARSIRMLTALRVVQRKK